MDVPTFDPSVAQTAEQARWATFEMLEERNRAESAIQEAISEFEARAESCRTVGTSPEPFVFAASYLRAKLDSLIGRDYPARW